MWRFLIPIGLFAVLAAFLFVGLGRDKETLPSPLIGKPAPQFELPRVDDPSQKISNREFAGRPYVLNIWGTWCVACREEHEALMEIARRGEVPHRRTQLEGRAAAGAALAAGSSAIRTSSRRSTPRATSASTGVRTARRKRSWSMRRRHRRLTSTSRR